MAAVVAIEQDAKRPEGRARPPSGAALRRWSLRGATFVYLGLFILLPVVAILQHGFGDGLTNLKAALDTFGAKAAIRLTLEMAALTAIINGITSAAM